MSWQSSPSPSHHHRRRIHVQHTAQHIAILIKKQSADRRYRTSTKPLLIGAAVRDDDDTICVEYERSLPVAPPVITPATFLFSSILYRNKSKQSMVSGGMEA